MINLPAPYYTSERTLKKLMGGDWQVRVFYLEQTHGARWPAFDISKKSYLSPNTYEYVVRYAGKLLDGNDKWVEAESLNELVVMMIAKHRMLKR